MMKNIYVLIVVIISLCLSSCWDYMFYQMERRNSFPFFYKVVDVDLQVYVEKGKNKKQFSILGEESRIPIGQDLFLKFTFKIKSDSKGQAEKGGIPSDIYTKCSKEKIKSFQVFFENHTKDATHIEDLLKGINYSFPLAMEPFIESREFVKEFKDLSDFVQKYNSCDPEVQGGDIQEYGLMVRYKVPVEFVGEKELKTEVTFSDGRLIMDEVGILIK